jgi:IclR family acetate operon transcriptional repressor
MPTRSPGRVADAADAPDDGPSGSSARSLALLAALARAGRALSLAELAAPLGLPKATAHRLAERLVQDGWLARDVAERSFTTGPALQRLALDTLNHGVQRGLRHRVLGDLVDRIGETCNFTTFDGAEVLYLDRVEAAWPLRLTLDVGSRVPLHCTASGKLFLAFLPEAERERVIEGLALARMTPRTITTAAALRAECARIAAAGHATDRQEFIAGLIAVAVPVRDAAGAVRAAVAVHAPVARLTLRAAEAALPALRGAARRMQALL